MKTTERLLQQLMRMEGLRLTAYKDAAGVPTIGVWTHKGRAHGRPDFGGTCP